MEAFENVLYSYIISIIESEFLEMGFSWKSCLLNCARSPPSKHTYARSNTYKINPSIYLLIIPIRIDFCS